MRLNKFIGNFDFSAGIIKITDENLVKQIGKVLRLEKTDRIILSDGKLNEALIEISKIDKNFVEGKIISLQKNDNESSRYGILYCAVLKKENFEIAAQKATEAGIKKIVPVITKRTVKLSIREERLLKIIREAAEQAERGLVPELGKIMTFGEAAAEAESNKANFFFDRNGIPLAEISKKAEEPQARIGIFVGPEGGWDPEEIKIAQERNFAIVNLGKLNLRAETAAIVGAYLLANKII